MIHHAHVVHGVVTLVHHVRHHALRVRREELVRLQGHLVAVHHAHRWVRGTSRHVAY